MSYFVKIVRVFPPGIDNDCTHFIAFRDMNVVANDVDVRVNIVK